MTTLRESLREARQEIAIRRLERFLLSSPRSRKAVGWEVASVKQTHADDPTIRLAVLRDLAIGLGYTPADLRPFDA